MGHLEHTNTYIDCAAIDKFDTYVADVLVKTVDDEITVHEAIGLLEGYCVKEQKCFSYIYGQFALIDMIEAAYDFACRAEEYSSACYNFPSFCLHVVEGMVKIIFPSVNITTYIFDYFDEYPMQIRNIITAFHAFEYKYHYTSDAYDKINEICAHFLAKTANSGTLCSLNIPLFSYLNTNSMEP